MTKYIKDIKFILVVSISIVIAIAIISFGFNGFNIGNAATAQWWGINFMYSFFLTVINTVYFRVINYKIAWENKGFQRVLFGAGGSIITTIIGYTLCEYVTTVFILERLHSNNFWILLSFKDYIFPLLFTTVLSLFFHTMYFYKALQEKKVNEQKIIVGTVSAKFTALKNQLDPHFLFNSLNVLTSLIEENPILAQKFTTSLSKVYRYVLEQKNKELVSVAEELKFANTYMTLLKLRFEDSIIFEIPDQTSDPEAKVVPLSLQILLENTVKHNIVMPEKPLHIKIYEKNGYLIVENNLQPKNILKQKSGVGLANVQQRYALLTKREFKIFKTDHSFIAKLPILTKQITIKTMEIEQDIALANDSKYNRAKERVQNIKGFYGNLASYCIVIPFLIFINYYTTRFRFPWFVFPMFGWGLGLFFHYCEAFGWHPIFGKDWEKRKIQRYMDASSSSTNTIKKRNYE